MATENLAIHTTGLTLMFNQQVREFLSPLALTPEGDKVFRRLVLSEAIDLVGVNESDMLLALNSFIVPEHLFNPYFDLSTGERQLKAMITLSAITIRNFLDATRRLDPRASYYYRSSLNYDFIVIGVEIYSVQQLQQTLEHFGATDQLNIPTIGDTYVR